MSRRLKLGSHVDSRQMYRVYGNQAAAAYCSFISSFFFLSKFKYYSILVHTWTVGRCIVYTENRADAAYSSLYFFILLSNFQTLKL